MTQTSQPAVRIPLHEGRRSSSELGRSVVADSLATVDDAAAARARAEDAWRTGYVEHFLASTRLAARSAATASTIAAQGLAAFRERMRLATATSEEPLRAPEPVETHRSERVVGTARPVTRLEVPYRGEVLSGDRLRWQLEAWVEGGVVEPGFADALVTAIEQPELLTLPGRTAVLVGAGAAMGPYASLVRWGADVAAIDVPVPAVWERLRRLAAEGAGTVTLPVDAATGEAGLDVADQLGAVLAWTGTVVDGAAPVLGLHAYADGARHVEATAASDVLAESVLADHPDATLAYLATPTDSFLVPEAAVTHARARWSEPRWNGRIHAVARTASRGRLFAPAYAEVLGDDAGRSWGLVNTLVPVQGPNYALAKRVQRWRAVTTAAAGRRVSATVAPASWTRSVTRNRVLASVYGGAHRFGVEIFRAETASVLLAAKLAVDAAAAPAPLDGRHPESLYADDAAHGGLWRQPFEPHTALGVAAALGAPGTVRRAVLPSRSART